MGRHAKHLRRFPDWVSENYLREIENIYVEADCIQRRTGVEMEVDHIIPLKGEIVSGLHVPWNLQILTWQENRQKKNKFGGCEHNNARR